MKAGNIAILILLVGALLLSILKSDKVAEVLIESPCTPEGSFINDREIYTLTKVEQCEENNEIQIVLTALSGDTTIWVPELYLQNHALGSTVTWKESSGFEAYTR